MSEPHVDSPDMDGHEFFQLVHDHPDIEWLGVKEGKTPAEDEVYLRHTVSKLTATVCLQSILQHPWEDLVACLVGSRPFIILKQLNRIVGYYSSSQNWNPSKLAELRDRRKGEYALSVKHEEIDLDDTEFMLQPEVMDMLSSAGINLSCNIHSD